jgi:hypothetical protein
MQRQLNFYRNCTVIFIPVLPAFCGVDRMPAESKKPEITAFAGVLSRDYTVPEY